MSEWTPGQVVILKSGGPKLTVIKSTTSPLDQVTELEVTWFDKDDQIQTTVLADFLVTDATSQVTR